ncbi:MAG TPA: lytic murein transglycosylase [Vicinamibacterales bacterium]
MRVFVWALTLTLLQTDASRPAFSDWLTAVRQEALSRGIRQEIVDAALSGLDEPMPIILERDRAQAEVVLPLENYLRRILTARRIRTGRERYADERELLNEVGQKYGVPPRIIAAIWGVESNFGRFSGVRPTIAALATLAWDPRRATFFRGELFDALEILNRGDIDLADMKGSWAGAMGQVQFMPSSYLKFAEDYDGDGRKDIWSSPGDVFASIANYLRGHGWTSGEAWGREVAISSEALRHIHSDVPFREGSCRATRDMTVAQPLTKWAGLGVHMPGGKPLPKSDTAASLVSGAKRQFLVYTNYEALLEYNCAHSYAISVALLADAIAQGPAEPAKHRPAKANAPGQPGQPGQH